jgi:hypothetical protein
MGHHLGVLIFMNHSHLKLTHFVNPMGVHFFMHETIVNVLFDL